ncbi:MAG: ABC transporter related protein [uncultured bacterium]|nr:MAG: ABC transporter related protein [uncultured bacterium]OGT55957.1 MAG: sugar ABC transporter ATP-binding protein [Gammaproteobacteria bacterium RIFCSPHIGHO2_12_FULL_42_10]
MAMIDLNGVSIIFPVYNVSARSFKKDFLRMATGGSVVEDAKHRVVVHALQNISLSLRDGDRVGLIGHNGAGKSTLLRLLARIYEPALGYAKIEGRVSPMLDITHSMEDEFTGRENIAVRGAIFGLTHQEIQEKIAEIADFSGLGDYLSMPMRTYSSGMFVRLAFAIASCIEPDILLIDEVFGAGDADFMEKARKKMVTLLNQSNIVVMANHADDVIRQFCNKAVYLEGGQVKYFGDVNTAFELYKEEL